MSSIGRSLVIASMALIGACTPQHSSGGGVNSCQPARTSDESWVMPTAGLAGGYRFEVISQGASHKGNRVDGVLWLWPALTTDSSLKTGKHAAPRDSARVPYYGATDVDFWSIATNGPRDEASLRAQTDPIYPEVLVTASSGISKEKPWQELEMWVGSVANKRDGSMGLDGAGYNMLITDRDSAGFRGTWGPAGIAMTDTGYFCARRLP